MDIRMIGHQDFKTEKHPDVWIKVLITNGIKIIKCF